METIINKVALSALSNINLERFLSKENFIAFDLKGYLFMELILKEKDFREALKNIDWTIYKNAIVCIHCSADAIIPMWANMLVASYLAPEAKDIQFGTIDTIKNNYLIDAINKMDITEFVDKRVVVKGCGEEALPENAYVAITKKLFPVVKSIMYGEPCSTVPIYKSKKV